MGMHRLDYASATTFRLDAGQKCTIPKDGVASVSIRCPSVKMGVYGFADLISNKRDNTIVSIAAPPVPDGIYAYARQEVTVSKGEVLLVAHTVNVTNGVELVFIPFISA